MAVTASHRRQQSFASFSGLRILFKPRKEVICPFQCVVWLQGKQIYQGEIFLVVFHRDLPNKSQ